MHANPRTTKRNNVIKAEFQKLVKSGKYTKEYIYQQLAEKYFLAPTTVERIIWGEYESRQKRYAERVATGKVIPMPTPTLNVAYAAR